MRFHQLKIKNMASLKGEHLINFSEIASNSNLFAITGKTGAGKSTLLNCISLALYGEVYKKGASGKDLVTTGTPLGQVELKFSVENQTYRALWKMRIQKKNGEYLKKPQLIRNLFKVNDETEFALDTPIENITKLNFNQFCKTTILNQGEFARFLTSNFTERKEILQKFYNDESLDILAIHLRQKLNKIHDQVLGHENKIEGMLDSFANINIDKKELDEFSSLITNKQEILHWLKDIQINFKDLQVNFGIYHLAGERITESKNKIIELTKSHNETLASFDQFNKELEAFTKIYQEKHPQLKAAVQAQIKYQEKQKQYEQISQQAHELKERLQKTKLAISEQEHKLGQAQKSIDNLEQSFPQLKEDKGEKILEEIERILYLKRDQSQLLQKLQNSRQELTHKKSQQQELTSELEQLQRTITAINEDKQQELIAVMEKEIAQAQQKSLVLDSLFKTNSELRETSDKWHKQLHNWESEQKEHADMLVELASQIKLNETQLERFKLSQAIDLCQQQSQDTGHCLVCGNEELPQKLPTVAKETDSIQLQVNLEHTKQQKQTVEKSLQTCQIHLERLKQDIKQEQEEQKINEEQIRSELANLNITLAYTPSNGSTIKELLTTQIEEKKHKRQELNHNLNTFYIKQNNINLLRAQKEKLNQEVEEKSAALKLDRSLLKQIEENILNSANKYQLSTEIEQLTNFKHAIASLLKFKNEREINQLELKNSQHQLDEYQEQLIKVERSLKQLNENITQHKDIVARVTPELNPATVLTELEQKQSELYKSKEKWQKNIQIQEVELASYQSKLGNYEEQYKNSYLKCVELKTQLNTLTTQEQTKHFSAYLAQPLVVLTEKIYDLKLDHLKLDILAISTETLKKELINFEQELQNQQNQLAGQRKLWEQKQDTKNKIKEITSTNKNLKEKHKQLELLNQLIGKDEFRNYVLSIIEELLIEQTNKELRILCQGRYAIGHEQLTNRMATEFKIIDYYKDAKERKISTLSGGETFLVSLAMALALAELTRGSAEIDSLFIDEGFGSLDTDSIEDVLELLEQVQHTGKQIGIISHIRELTNRIPLNVNVNKSDNGISHIKVLYN